MREGLHGIWRSQVQILLRYTRGVLLNSRAPECLSNHLSLAQSIGFKFVGRMPTRLHSKHEELQVRVLLATGPSPSGHSKR